MEEHSTLRQLLESLYATKDRKSWTIHENEVGTVCTIRFIDTASAATRENHELPKKTTTFKPKSQYQVKRDRVRMENFNSRVKTRSETAAENKRHGDSYKFAGDINASLICSVSSSHDTSVESLQSDMDSLETKLTPLLVAHIESPAPELPVLQPPIDLPSISNIYSPENIDLDQ